MSLNLDGILNVTAIEKRSGLSKHIAIARALETKSEAEIAAARKRLEALYATRQDHALPEEEFDEAFDEDASQREASEEDGAGDAQVVVLPSRNDGGDWDALAAEGRKMIERARQLLDQIHEDDREEVIDLNQTIETAMESQDAEALNQALHELRELLFFVEGRA